MAERNRLDYAQRRVVEDLVKEHWNSAANRYAVLYTDERVAEEAAAKLNTVVSVANVSYVRRMLGFTLRARATPEAITPDPNGDSIDLETGMREVVGRTRRLEWKLRALAEALGVEIVSDRSRTRASM